MDLLTISSTATICGAESCLDIADFGDDRAALFREFLDLPGGLPSHDTCSRLFCLLDPAVLAGWFASFLDGLGADRPGVVAIDAKMLRRSFDTAASRSPLHMVTAFAADANVAIGQATAGDKESEILAARQLLGLLDPEGVLVTGDARHCQGETARLITARGRGWLFAFKANRAPQHAEVAAWFADPLN